MSTPEATASDPRCPECGDLSTHPLDDNCPTQIDWAEMRDDLGIPAPASSTTFPLGAERGTITTADDIRPGDLVTGYGPAGTYGPEGWRYPHRRVLAIRHTFATREVVIVTFAGGSIALLPATYKVVGWRPIPAMTTPPAS